jgi:hypothetical protein
MEKLLSARMPFPFLLSPIHIEVYLVVTSLILTGQYYQAIILSEDTILRPKEKVTFLHIELRSCSRDP